MRTLTLLSGSFLLASFSLAACSGSTEQQDARPQPVDLGPDRATLDTVTPDGARPDSATTGYSFRQIGPHGGFVSAVVFHPQRVGELWASGDDTSGVYRSKDSGLKWRRLEMGGRRNLAGFALRFDPANPRRIFFAEHYGRGLLVSEDEGSSWRSIGVGLPDPSTAHGQARRFYDLAISPLDSRFIFAATGAGLYRSTDSLRAPAIFSLSVDPTNPKKLLAGGYGADGGGAGIYQTENGSAGPWVKRLTAQARFQALKRDLVSSDLLYAAALPQYAGAPAGETGIYVATDGGTHWRHAPGSAGKSFFVVPRPKNEKHAVALGLDAFATTDAFASPATSLKLAARAPGEFFSAGSFAPHDPKTILVGTSNGRLFASSNYTPGGMTADDWREVSLPFRDAGIFGIVITEDSRWYVSAVRADVEFSKDTRQGLLRSVDQGKTWEFVHRGIGPSEAIWRLKRSVQDPLQLYLGMYGGGLLLFRDP